MRYDGKKSFPLTWILLGILFFLLFMIGNRFAYLVSEGNEQGLMWYISLGVAFESTLQSILSRPLMLSFKPPHLFAGFVPIIGILGAYYLATTFRKNTRYGEEHGSARYGDIEKEASKLKNPEPSQNTILTQEIWLSLDTRVTFLNNNVMVIGGSGSGKTRYFVKPNILQFNANVIVADPNEGLLPEIGKSLIEEGYDVKALNLVKMWRSMKYNPLRYIYNPVDVFKFVNNLINNTNKEGQSSGDGFWEKSEITLLTSLVFTVLGLADKSTKNMNTVMELLDLAEASEEDENSKSVLDIIMDELEEELEMKLSHEDRRVVNACKNSYEYLGLRQYKLFKKAAGKTAKSILISLSVRLAVFNLPEVQRLLEDDELNLEVIGRPETYVDEEGVEKLRKTALFLIISDSDTTFSFLVSILYQQLLDMLYMIADGNEDGRLPITTRIYFDEFANTGKQQDIEFKIATNRKRNIDIFIILQNLAQIKALYKDSWETLEGNCDTTLFLGGKEFSTLERLSKIIGQETVAYTSVSESKGGQGSVSKSTQLINRALLAPDEIGRLKTTEALVHIRGQHIFKDKKYDLLSHPNIERTTDGKDGKKNRYNFVQDLIKKREQGVFANQQNEVMVDTEEFDMTMPYHLDGYVSQEINI